MLRRAVFLAVALGVALPAFGHRLKVFAMAEGRKISGYVYFPGGGRAVGVTVRALAPDGSELARATTNEKGEFELVAQHRCDHTIVAETPDGHKASFVVEASELPDDLPPLGGAPGKPKKPAAAQAAPAARTPVQGAALKELVSEAVAKELRPLREQLEAYEAKRRLHDIIGGIDYILGISGVAFYLLGKRRGTPTP